MTASIAITTSDFTSGLYTYKIKDGVLLRIFRSEEALRYLTTVVDLSFYLIDVVVTDSEDNVTATKQPSVVGITGSVCTITPVSDTSLNGYPLTDDTLESVTFEVSYDE